MSNIKEVIKEASLSIACALDEPEDVTVKDLEHIQNQITTIENYFDRWPKQYMKRKRPGLT